jgi:AraC-like DNA-binding protein
MALGEHRWTAKVLAHQASDPAFFNHWYAPLSRCSPTGNLEPMSPQTLSDLQHLRRAKDFIDREYASPLDISKMARTACMSPAHFSRSFRVAYGETPYAYLMTRRIERAKAFLRQGMSVTDACLSVGCTSLGSFSSRFRELVGMTPSQYRDSDHGGFAAIPSCVSMLVTRPRRSSHTPEGAARSA